MSGFRRPQVECYEVSHDEAARVDGRARTVQLSLCTVQT